MPSIPASTLQFPINRDKAQLIREMRTGVGGENIYRSISPSQTWQKWKLKLDMLSLRSIKSIMLLLPPPPPATDSGLVGWKHAEICLFLIYVVAVEETKFTVGKVECLRKLFALILLSLALSASLTRLPARQTIMQKLELCPKIKLNKSLLCLSLFHFFRCHHRLVYHRLFSFSLSSLTRKRKIFSRFSTSTASLVRLLLFCFSFLLFSGWRSREKLFSHCSTPWH
jgi:hypothetical protein